MKKLLKTIYYWCVRLLPARGVVVLMYHSVGYNDAFFTVKPDEFARQMKYLSEHGYSVISSRALIEMMKRGGSLLSKTVVLTFDDGYRDNYEYAFPILRQYGFPASIFLTTGTIGHERTTSTGITLPMLSWQQIKEMAADRSIEFFPHSDTHPKFDLIASQEVEHELRISKDILENELHATLTVFAYPYGRSNATIRDIVQRLGYSAAYSVKPGRLTGRTDLFQLNRNSVDSGVTFGMFKGIVRQGRI